MPRSARNKARNLLPAATTYRACGWRIVLLHGVLPDGSCTCGASDCPAPGQHARHVLDEVGPRSEDFRCWFVGTWADSNVANLGVLLGPEGKLVVLETDDGQLAALEAEHGAMAITPRLITPSGAALLFRHPGGLMPDRVAVDEGVVLRSSGIALLPPSRTMARYTWYPGQGPQVAVALLPDWLLNLAGQHPATDG